ncbi:MAG: hypothetical protein K6F22_05175 [Prevotella sp.]|nr:hypothetical protein [Prevotella sp.]
MKKKVILHILLLAALSAALLYITKSWWMSLGILMLILLVDALLKQYDAKRRYKWELEQRKKREAAGEENETEDSGE